MHRLLEEIKEERQFKERECSFQPHLATRNRQTTPQQEFSDY